MSNKFTRSRFRTQPTPKICNKGPREPGDPQPPPPKTNTASVNATGTTSGGQDIFISTTAKITRDNATDLRAEGEMKGGKWELLIQHTLENNTATMQFITETNTPGELAAEKTDIPLKEKPPWDTGTQTLQAFEGSGTVTARAVFE